MKKIKQVLIGLLVPCLLLILWILADRMQWVGPALFPSLRTVGETLRAMTADGSLATHIGSSFTRLGWGFMLALCLAAPLGFLLGQIRFLHRLLMPTLIFFQQIPPIAWIPFFILWFGLDDPAKIAVITYSAFMPIFLNTVQGVHSLDPLLRETAHSFKLPRRYMILRVHLPSAAGPLFVGFRLGLSNSWRALVGAEMIASSSQAGGIGALINEGRAFTQPAKVIIGILIIGLAGLILDVSLRSLEKILVPWQTAKNKG